MKALLSVFAILVCTTVLGQNFNQQRYTQRLFNQTDTVKNIEFANAPWLNNIITDIPQLASYNIHKGEGTTQNKPLFMDVYKPSNDTCTKRPAIIFAHGGAFIHGSRHNQDIMALCDSFAKLGYVTASIDYRLGIGATITRNGSNEITNITIQSNNFDRAVYRGIQDSKAAIRFLKANAMTYGIDTNYVFMAGSSAGAIVALNNIYMDKTGEIPTDFLASQGGRKSFVKFSAIFEFINFLFRYRFKEWFKKI